MSLHLGDCLDVLRGFDACSIDAVVTDPPYGISFMGKHWDRFDIERRVGKRDVSKLGVRLTGGADSSNRKLTSRTASAFANAAGEAGGYDVSLSGNRAFQAWVCEVGVELLRVLKPGGHALVFGGTRTYHRLASGLEDAGFEIRDTLAWMFGQGFPKSLNLDGEREGWGTALKPAFEPISLARKPFAGTVAGNVRDHGTGALNIDGCRIEGAQGDGNWSGRDLGDSAWFIADQRDEQPGAANERGRWPANVILDEEAAAILDEQTGELTSGLLAAHHGRTVPRFGGNTFGHDPGDGATAGRTYYGDSGGASRFFYCAKVSVAERHAGIADGGENDHPTVKPIALMRYLARLVTPPGGVILDPFTGSGSTGCAAALEGFDFVGIDQDAHYLHEIAEQRIAFWREHGEDGLRIVAERDGAERRREEIRAAGQLDLLSEAASA